MEPEILLDIFLVSVGFLIIVFAISLNVQLRRSVLVIKSDLDKLTSNLFGTYMVLLVLFAIGYGFIDASLLMGLKYANMLVVALIFFFGSLFVLIGITVQIRLTNRIYSGNIQLIRTMVNAVEARDNNLKGHSLHVCAVSLLIYSHMPKSSVKHITQKHLEYASLLHDIGKLGIPENVLNKPGKLDESEWALMREHPRIGVKILSGVKGLSNILDWILYHHERMDGNGYYKLSGDAIPLASRIIAVADAYSALVMVRSYKPALSHERAVEIMNSSAGTHFDPEILNIFSKINIFDIQKKLEVIQSNNFD